MTHKGKKRVVEIVDIPEQLIELTDTEAKSIIGGSPTLPLPPPRAFAVFSFSLYFSKIV